MSRFAAAVQNAVREGFEAQACAHGEALHTRAVAIRARDPLATFLLDTFERQVKDYGARAQAAHAAGKARAAVELATSCERCIANLGIVRAAVET